MISPERTQENDEDEDESRKSSTPEIEILDEDAKKK